MNMKTQKKPFRCPFSGWGGALLLMAAGGVASSGATNSIPSSPTNSLSATTNVSKRVEKPPVSPREFFNAGTRRLQEGKWREAETLLQQALLSQNETFQPAALHNLGHVRYAQGAEELKKAPDTKAVTRRSEQALARGDRAVQQAEEALASAEVRRMVTAYLNGRGARKELREALDLVRRSLEAYGGTLQKWQRALGDFQSALELNPADAAARENVKTIEAAIAKLLDKMQQLAQLGQMLGQMRQDLGELMSDLRGQIPAPEAPPGDDGEEADEDDAPNGPKEGQEQKRGSEGTERGLTPEEAGWLLESFKLGGNRQLPMGPGEESKPKDRKGKNW